MNPEIHHEPSEISYDEQFYPARPRPLKPSVRRATRVDAQTGEPVPDNPNYVEWLINQSILHDAKLIAEQLSGQASMWQNPYAVPEPARGGGEGLGVVHRLSAVVHHRPGCSPSWARWATGTCGRRSSRSG